ncbi:transmembrane protein 213 [Alligator sinensis]|uniref:Transmembrane protein 213 n=1 Tax=Alligator sinensis TaxID=38654 RepID=A0A1U7RK76_ALLSI|nr:transmembrane protein 213 [Alligator sinensis]
MKHFARAFCTTTTTLILLLTILWSSYSAEAKGSSNGSLVDYIGSRIPAQCPHMDFCPQAAKCCQLGVDEYGWIAAAVGWSLWFLTLILLCVDKLMKLRPDEPKYLQA